MKGDRARTEQLCLREGAVLPAGEVMKEDRKRDRHVDADLTCLDLVHKTASKPAVVGEDRCTVAERVPCDDRNGLLVTVGTDDRQHRAEQFIGMQRHAGAHVVDQTRAEKPSVTLRHDAAAIDHD